MIFSIIIWINMILDRAGTAATVIGWIQFGLLTLLIGIPLLFFFIVMMVPFRYDLKGVLQKAKEFRDGEVENEEEPSNPDDTLKNTMLEWVYKVTDPIEGIGKVSWFSGLIKGEVLYKDRELSWKAKVLFKKISSEKLDKEKKKDKSNEDSKEKNKNIAVQGESQSKEENTEAVFRGDDKSKEKNIEAVVQDESKSTEKVRRQNKVMNESVLSHQRKTVEREEVVRSENRQETVSISENIERSDEDNLKNRDDDKDRDRDKNRDRDKDRDKDKDKENSKNIEDNEEKEEREDQEDDRSILEKIQEFFERLSEGFETITEKIEYTYELICDKIDLALELKENISNFVSYETHQEAYSKLKKELKKLWVVVKPARIKGRVKIGFENPMTTGLVVAGVSLIHPYTNGNARIEADFDEQVLEGELQIKGKMRLGSLVWFALKMYMNKSVQITIKNGIKFVNKNRNMMKKESIKEI